MYLPLSYFVCICVCETKQSYSNKMKNIFSDYSSSRFNRKDIHQSDLVVIGIVSSIDLTSQIRSRIRRGMM